MHACTENQWYVLRLDLRLFDADKRHILKRHVAPKAAMYAKHVATDSDPAKTTLTAQSKVC